MEEVGEMGGVVFKAIQNAQHLLKFVYYRKDLSVLRDKAFPEGLEERFYPI